VPRTFGELFDWFDAGLADAGDPHFQRLARGQHHPGTLRRFYRRLRRVVHESSGIFRVDAGPSRPLELETFAAGRATVVDLASLADSHLQRFVVAALLKQAKELQTGGRAVRGMHYLFVLDEAEPLRAQGQQRPDHQAGRGGRRRAAGRAA